jgi:thymidylate synthase (FAD)
MNITVDNSFIEVLDHGYVRLVDSMGSDLSIVRSARVSYSADWRSGDDEKSDEKLLRFLWRNKHTSPFEAVEFQFEIKCPIFVARQWHRHRTQSYNEVSARYTELPEEYYVPDTIVIGKQDEKNKQSRMISASVSNEYGDSIYIVNEHHKNCFELYKDLLKNGWPRELARSVLPMATYTRFFAKSNLRNWLHFLELRLDSHAQYEIRVYAEAIKTLIRPIIPVTWEIMYG